MEIYYLHKERKIVKSHFDTIGGDEIAFDEACKMVDSGEASDCNLAFQTLRDNNGDMEAVENYYQSC